ncbi:MAG: leucyl aminopeptidase, partial [Propionibacteriaceae bacterium]|nr:leucyl aminopeptidase [Propionibacteriaceae bacterium]
TEVATLSVAVSLAAEEPEELRAVAEGALLGSYTYAPISSTSTSPPMIDDITVITTGTGPTAADKTIAAAASIVASAVLTAREWVNIPPNLLYPHSFAEEVRALVKNSRITVEVLDERALERAGFGGILAVGGGSSRPPRLVRLSYAPRGATFHLALVGKGITFDSGGLNIKPSEGMYTMKCDMAGAATVFAATHAIAKLGLKVKVTAYGALAENLPSDTAYRPSDVLTMYGGKTVENGNSDAEGRLVLADALARANEDSPDLVVDVATLTGAVIVALGDRTSGLLATDDETADRVLDAAEAAGEDFWQLPIPKDIRPKLESKVADLRSTSGDRFGGALVAAAFLREFVADDVSWAHLDIAGPAFYDGKPYGYVGPGGTGVGVRTLVALAASLQDDPRKPG